MAINPEELGTEIVDQTLDQTGSVARTAMSKINQVGEKVGEYYHDGMEKAEEAKHNVERFVQGRPLQSLLIAAGIALGAGFLIGSLIRRR